MSKVPTFFDAGQAGDDHEVLKLAPGYGMGAAGKVRPARWPSIWPGGSRTSNCACISLWPSLSERLTVPASKAPAVLLPSNSGASHAKISAAQRAFRRQNGYGTTARQEFSEAARQMRAAGVPEKSG